MRPLCAGCYFCATKVGPASELAAGFSGSHSVCEIYRYAKYSVIKSEDSQNHSRSRAGRFHSAIGMMKPVCAASSFTSSSQRNLRALAMGLGCADGLLGSSIRRRSRPDWRRQGRAFFRGRRHRLLTLEPGKLLRCHTPLRFASTGVQCCP